MIVTENFIDCLMGLNDSVNDSVEKEKKRRAKEKKTLNVLR